MDKIATVKKSLQLHNWAQMAAARQSSGLTVAQWCENEQISKSVYYYRLRKVRENICEQIPVPVAQIAPVEAASSTTMTITCGEMSMQINGNATAERIASVVRALKC